MFTGIVEEVGRVMAVDRKPNLQRTTVGAKRTIEGVNVGDSVSINGACHTAVSVSDDRFVVESVAETITRTTMGDLSVGDGVNLERSVRLSDRLDGHLVQGHVDGIGVVTARDAFDDNVNFTFEVDAEIGRYVAEKGSVAVDGISLTVVAVSDAGERSRFSVTVIPHTLAETVLADRQPGDRVNVEVDVIARYLERLLKAGQAGGLSWPDVAAMGYER